MRKKDWHRQIDQKIEPFPLGTLGFDNFGILNFLFRDFSVTSTDSSSISDSSIVPSDSSDALPASTKEILY